MSNAALTLRHLCLTGPQKEKAIVSFGPGLNVIYGASETGKSFIVEAIDFMLGSSAELRDIPERVGFDRMFLGVEAAQGSTFTLERSTSGGQFRYYDGLHMAPPQGIEPLILAARHNPTRDDNLSTFLLNKVGLSGRRIRRNVRGDLNNLSFRNLAHFSIINEGDIQKQGSPIETGQVISRTPEMAVFKLLLTGVDDSALQAATRDETESLSRAAKIDVIDQLIADYRERLSSLIGEEDDRKELDEQLRKLDESLARETATLRETEQAHRAIVQRRTDLRRRLEHARSRRSEIDELVTRFDLLDQHYKSDLARLEGLREAGSLVGALGPETCPLCGAPPQSQHREDDCDGNIDLIIAAADAECAKIGLLRSELLESVRQLKSEAARFDESMPQIVEQLGIVEGNLEEFNPSVLSQRAAYTDLFEKRATVRDALSLMSSISDLEGRKIALEASPGKRDTNETLASELSTATLDAFSLQYENVLKSWNFPDASRVYFDKASRDFVISGKLRGSRGKGMRAVTYAAFTVSLLQFTKSHELPHPGFAVLDTPLLAYREPESDEDDLSETDVQDRFYDYLSKMKERQVIVLENNDPPESIRTGPQTTFFSKNPHKGRYGFFPL